MADVPSTSASCQEESSSIGDHEFTLLLIALYRDCPELWKIKSKEYLNKHKRGAALDKILKVLKYYKPEYNQEKLKKKINVLRTNFNKEYQKIKQKKRSSACSDDIPQPTLWYYNEFLFIKDQQPLIEESPKPSDKQPATHKKKKKITTNSTEELIGLPTPYFKGADSEADVIAKGWSMKLSRLPPDQRRFAEKIINDTFFEAEMGTLTRNGVLFLTSLKSSMSSASSSGSHSSTTP